jgi:diaminopropionate ammonia-lyase
MVDDTGVILRRGARPGSYPQALQAILSEADVWRARTTIASWPGYAPTPLLDLPRLAARLGVARVDVKIEGARFEVGSFKALGPPYALSRAIARRNAPDGAGFTAVAATSGNHGRALAWGARRLGAASRIFMPAHTSTGRGDAIACFGAEVVRVPGNFDAALDAAVAEARRSERNLLIADVSIDGGCDVARDTLAGYAVLADEIMRAPGAAGITHLFVAAGNGTLAAASCARLWQLCGAGRPCVISAEPGRSDCLRASIAADAPVTLADAGESVMDGLVVGTPSRVAWPILRAGIDAAVTVSEESAVAALRDLAAGAHGDPPLQIGETGIAAIAALIDAARNPAARETLGIGRESRLTAIACEGVTDRAVFDSLVGGRG